MIKEFQGDYRWLSNFAPVSIKLNNRVYSSVEHAYQSEKSDSLDWKEFCSSQNVSAGQVKKESRKVKLKPNWDELKVEVMKECLKQKFEKQPYKNLLLKTGDEYIQEGNYWNDTFWGVDLKTNKGSNILGKLIMEIRSKL